VLSFIGVDNIIMNKTKISLFLASFTTVISILSLLTGCNGGGGGTGTSLPPTNVNPVHTTFNQNQAYVSQAGQSFTCSVTVSETRGDEINFSKMYTYRTFADSANTGKTAYYYNSSPSTVYGWMFDIAGTMSPNFRDAVVTNQSSVSGWSSRTLKPYERRTYSVNVMIGTPSQTKPAGFTGFFIPNSDYATWKTQGHTGIRYWISFEGYDSKLKDTYNLHIPLEVNFPNNLSTDPYPVNTGTGTGTDPYDPLRSKKE